MSSGVLLLMSLPCLEMPLECLPSGLLPCVIVMVHERPAGRLSILIWPPSYADSLSQRSLPTSNSHDLMTDKLSSTVMDADKPLKVVVDRGCARHPHESAQPTD